MASPNCIMCPVMDTYVGLVEQHIAELSEALLPGMQALFITGLGIWFVLEGYRWAIGSLDIPNMVVTLICAFIASGLLAGQGVSLVETIFNIAIETMGGAASVALIGDAAGQVGEIHDSDGLAQLVSVAENALERVFDITGLILEEAGFSNPMPFIYAIVLILPYFLLLVVFAAQITVAIFRLMMLAAFAPYLFLVMTFGFGRKLLPNAISTVIASIMVVFAVTVVLGMVVSGLNALVDKDGGALALDVSLKNAEFIVAIALGWISIALMTEATSIANSIAQTQLTNTAIGVMTAGATTTAAAGAAASAKGARGATNLATSAQTQDAVKQATMNRIMGAKNLATGTAKTAALLTTPAGAAIAGAKVAGGAARAATNLTSLDPKKQFL